MKAPSTVRYAFLLCSLFSCRAASDQSNSLIATPITSIQERVVRVPSDTSDVVYNGLISKNSVVYFYADTNFIPVWTNKSSLTAQADSLIAFVGKVNYYGLPIGRYHFTTIKSLVQDSSEVGKLRTEVLLTDAFFTLSHDLKFGIGKIGPDYDSTTAALLGNALLNGKLKTLLRSREPVYTGYKLLIHKLRTLLDSARSNNVEVSTLEDRIRLININLQRWRKEREYLAGRYAYINVPSFMFYLVQAGDTLMTSKVIVGASETRTPQLSSIIECFTIYPYWHVPRKISVEEYLPVIQRDTSFLSKNNFDVLDRKGNILSAKEVPWGQYSKDYFPVSLRQREGSENALGLIKFYFDNPYAVFLHDTNAKRLFKSKSRAFSHGCIRMEKAQDLAHYLATGEMSRKSKLIEKYLSAQKRSTINAIEALPIHIRYFTTDVVNGKLMFYNDIYGKDQLLMNEMNALQTIDSL